MTTTHRLFPLLTGLVLTTGLQAQVATPQTTPADTTIYQVVERDPEFPGGYEGLYQYLASNIRYPEGDEQCEGTVYVQFVVERDGRVSHAQVLRDAECGLGEEALRVVNGMPRWKPGKLRGKKVRVLYRLSVRFRKE